MEFESLESSLYVKLAEAMGSEGTLHGFEYPGSYRAGYFLIDDEDDPIYLVFTFPRKLDDCYLTFTDGSPEQVVSEIAALQQYNEEISPLSIGLTAPVLSDYMNSAGWVAFLITHTQFAFERLPNNLTLLDRNLSLHLALPLNESEYDTKTREGYEGVLGLLVKERRDLAAYDWNCRIY